MTEDQDTGTDRTGTEAETNTTRDLYTPPRRTPVLPADDYHGAGHDPDSTSDGLISRFLNDISCVIPDCTHYADRLVHSHGRQPEPHCGNCAQYAIEHGCIEYPLSVVLDDLFDGTIQITDWTTRDGRTYELANSADSDDNQWIHAANTSQETSVVSLEQWA